MYLVSHDLEFFIFEIEILPSPRIDRNMTKSRIDRNSNNTTTAAALGSKKWLSVEGQKTVWFIQNYSGMLPSTQRVSKARPLEPPD